MTPQERKLVDDLFDKLATLENQPRERDAEQTIMDGLRRAPNAVYALVQTVLLQDEALKQATARIRDLEAGQMDEPQQGGGFLDSMRDTLFGGGNRPRSSVPPVGGDRPMGVPPGYRGDTAGSPGAWGQQGSQSQGSQQQGLPPQQPGGPQQGGPQQGGGSFLGTAAAAAVGTLGGAMLMNSLGGLFGHGKQGATSAAESGGGKDANPWGGGGGDASQSDLAKQAGLDGVGQSGNHERSSFGDTSNQDRGNDGHQGGSDQDYANLDDGYGDDMDDDFDYGDDSDFA